MGALKTNEKSDTIRLSAAMNNLWGELNTATISHATRMELEEKLTGCEEQFRALLNGEGSLKDLEKNLNECDQMLALAAVKQAENEIPSAEKNEKAFLALENIRRELNDHKISPLKARHEVKNVIRHQL